MLQVNDVRETRVFQEALEEGLEKGLEKGRQEIARRLLARKYSAEDTAELTGLSVAQVKKLKKQGRR